jgi:DNA mismatch endonuclease, patch repair protein
MDRRSDRRAATQPGESAETVGNSWASSPAVRRNMQANRGRDTGPEKQLRHLLHASGLRYRIHWPVPADRRRRIDIAFTRYKVAVFVDGCFWHRCPSHYVAPKAHAVFWDTKTKGTTERDATTTAMLVSDGWLVLRCWEHEDPHDVLNRVLAAVQARSLPGRNA